MLTLHKHKIIRQERNTGKRGGGLSLYVRDSIFAKTCIMSEISNVSSDLEQLWISIEEPNVRKKIWD